MVNSPPRASMAAPTSRQHLGQLVGPKPGEAAGGGQQVQPLVAGVGPLPVEPPLLAARRTPGLADPVGELGVHRPGRPPGSSAPSGSCERRVGHHPPVGGGERLGHLGGWLEHVPEDRQPPAGAQHLRRLGRRRRPGPPSARTGRRSPRRTSGRPVPRPRRSPPRPEATARGRSRPSARSGSTPSTVAARGLELAGGDAGAAADVEHVGAGAGGDDRAHQGVGVAGRARS